MSPKRDKSRDWYKISVDTLRGWGLFLTLLALAGGGYLGFKHWEQTALQREAGRIIDEDARLLQQIQSGHDLAALRAEYDAAFSTLELARRAYVAADYRIALDRAVESQALLQSILNATQAQRAGGDARFMDVQGRVEYRQGERGEWRTARRQDLLRSGDYVKTGGNGSSQIMFDDGTLYTVRANTLFLVSATRAGGGEQTIRLQYGWVNLNTARRANNVATPEAEAVVATSSEAVVAYDERRREGEFTNLRGGAMQVKTTDGTTRRLEALQTVTQAGALLSQPKEIPAAPRLLSPADDQVVKFDEEDVLLLTWRPVNGASRYALQVSRSRLFTDNVIDVENRRTPKATLGLKGEGSFLWRVAALNADDLRGPWSAPQRFRVAAERGEGIADGEPPELELEEPQSYGSIFIVRGRTETGASVWVNGEAVALEADGTFTKTIQLVNQGWDFIEVRAADVWGNESTDRKRVYVESF